MKTGNGKIANLPAQIRDELNYRINDGDPGNELVQWLNSKPEVVEVVNELFDGTPISEQNLSEWRKHGYQKWLAHRNMFDESNALGDNAEVIAETGIDCDKLILTLVASYAEMIQCWITTPREEMTYKLAVYKKLTAGVLALQRAELQKIRVEIARERLELLREKRANKSPFSSTPSNETDTSSSNTRGSPQSDSESRHSPPSAPPPPEPPEVSNSHPAVPAPTKPVQLNEPTPERSSPIATPTPEPPDPRDLVSTSPTLSQSDKPTPSTPRSADDAEFLRQLREPLFSALEGSAPSLPRPELSKPVEPPVAVPVQTSQPKPSAPPAPNPVAAPPPARSNRVSSVPLRNMRPGTVISLNPLRIVPMPEVEP